MQPLKKVICNCIFVAKPMQKIKKKKLSNLINLNQYTQLYNKPKLHIQNLGHQSVNSANINHDTNHKKYRTLAQMLLSNLRRRTSISHTSVPSLGIFDMKVEKTNLGHFWVSKSLKTLCSTWQPMKLSA